MRVAALAHFRQQRVDRFRAQRHRLVEVAEPHVVLAAALLDARVHELHQLREVQREVLRGADLSEHRRELSEGMSYHVPYSQLQRR